MYSQANGQVPSADGQVLFRQVIIDKAPYWQASDGRTFPVVAGGEDPPGDGKGADPGADDAEQESADDYDKERGFRKMQAQAAELKKLKAERDALRAQTKELDALKAAQKQRDDADKSEADRLKEQISDLERKSAADAQTLVETQNRIAIERAATKAGAADPDDVFRLLDPASFERDDSGNLTNADALVQALLKAKPYLAGKPQPSGVPGSPRGNGTASRTEKIDELKDKLRATGNYNPL